MRCLFSVFLLAGCGRLDPDGDGLDNGRERELGTDPKDPDTDKDGLDDGDEIDHSADPLVPDTDGDGLNDGDEIANGADPTLRDTDGDGYTDRDEVFEGKDPANASSVIYLGGWPYYFDKDSISGADRVNAAKGKRFARMQMKDQFGDRVDLYDFYNTDKPVVIDLSTMWCPPCNGLSAYLEGEPDDYNFAEMWPAGPQVIARGDVYWITILGEDYSEEPATKPDATDWYYEYHNDAIPVLADNDYTSKNFVDLTAWPTVLLLEPDLTISNDVSEWWAEFVLPVLAERFPE